MLQSEHGGHTNAYTAAEDTNYHFDCNHDSLAEALDRFSQVHALPARLRKTEGSGACMSLCLQCAVANIA